MEQYRKGNGNHSGHEAMTRLDSDCSTTELYETAERDYFDHQSREQRDGRIRAYMHVLLTDPDRMQEGLREGLDLGGMLRAIPPSGDFPLNTGSLVYRSEAELRELTDPETAKRLIKDHQKERAEALAVYRQWATKLVEDVTLIAQTRLSGVPPGEIVTTENLKMALATEMVSQRMIESISTNRRKVQQAIAGLGRQSEEGVEAAPLADGMQQIGQFCQKMNQDMEKLERMAHVATGHLNEPGPRTAHSGVVTLTKRAREVFSPFIEGNHLITMEQLRGLEKFLHEAGEYNEKIGGLIEDGLHAIEEAKKAGRHQDVRKIENFLGFDQQMQGFEGMTRALNRDFSTRAVILANAGAQNRIILQSTPPDMLRQAEIESGLVAQHLLQRGMDRDMDLVLPANDDLELK